MEIIDFSKSFERNDQVITLGAFDGVHIGHQEILHRLKNKALELKAKSVVVSFWPHPRLVLKNDFTLKLLSTLHEKRSLLEKSGVDYLIEIPFNTEFAGIDSRTFIQDYLVKRFKIKYFLLGYNHHFGKDRLGNFDKVRGYAHEFGFGAEQVPPMEFEGEKVSSTKIRNALEMGNVKLANKFLGYDYPITGEVVRGKMLGRTIGFPTANIQVPERNKLLPKDGVYAVKLFLNGEAYKGMLNIGYRPTVNNDVNAKTIEVNLFDFNQDIYSETVTVNFIDRIRDEVKFSGIDDLKANLLQDMVNAKRILG